MNMVLGRHRGVTKLETPRSSRKHHMLRSPALQGFVVSVESAGKQAEPSNLKLQNLGVRVQNLFGRANNLDNLSKIAWATSHSIPLYAPQSVPPPSAAQLHFEMQAIAIGAEMQDGIFDRSAVGGIRRRTTRTAAPAVTSSSAAMSPSASAASMIVSRARRRPSRRISRSASDKGN